MAALSLLGPSASRTLILQLGVSQPTFSRLVRRNQDELLVVGRARATRYARRRTIEGLASPVPLYELRPPPHPPRQLLTLHPLHPDGYYVEPHCEAARAGFYDDLPWFLHDLRPAGFLGRLIPRQHPALAELAVPDDILRWSADHTLIYLARFGLDAPGAFILGEQAYAAWMQRARQLTPALRDGDRPQAYVRMAHDVLGTGPFGSSAAGEQPKFLASRERAGAQVAVLVKFSPPTTSPAAQRTADLLVAEHLALQVSQDHGHPAARSELILSNERVFLEVTRFDRVRALHRRGLISLAALDAQFVGSDLRSWSASTRQLAQLGLIRPEDHREACWREGFGKLIANTDMHHANLSFFLDGTDVTSIAPSYDMLPMAYRAHQGEIVAYRFCPQPPGPEDAAFARPLWRAALDFWRRLAADERVSAGFREIAEQNTRAVAALEAALALLPAG